MFDFINVIRDFLDKGGQVLWLIMILTFVLWALILERYFFFKNIYPQYSKDIYKKWSESSIKSSWWTQKIRNKIIAEAQTEFTHFIPLIKTLVTLCPLFGLLGTVTGMISIFDTMSLTGTGDVGMIASGISMATIPTMAGMFIALSGFYLSSLLEKQAQRNLNKIIESLSL